LVSKTDFDNLKKNVAEAELETRIKAAWAGIKDVGTYFKRSDIESDLASTFDALENTEFTETKAADQSTKILATAEDMLRFHGALARTIRDRRLAVQPAVDKKLREATLLEKKAELRAEEDKLEQRNKERDAANDTVQELLRAEPFNRDAFDQAQATLKEKEDAVQAQEGEVDTAKTAVRDAEAAVATARENLKKVEDAERAALALRATERVRAHYSKDAMCDRTLAIYDELLAETGRGRDAP